MLMSKSRLEKFLYALYSLDSSDLPTPISRIEELYNCWVTGEEVPTFEPLSRVEKYLMAILGVYDVDSLPNPLSRVEVLLYKLATGDDNLDDFKSFLSEHEKLLAEIIRNGGAGGNIDIEYVLYTLSTEFNTLYNTAEKPVKSAILKGNTIVSHYSSNIVELTANGSWIENPVSLTQITLPVKPSTDYLFIVEIIENSLIGDETINNSLRFGETEGTGRFPSVFKSISAIPLHQLGMYRFILTTKADISGIDIFDRKQLSKHCTGGKIKFRYMVIEYQQGMENWDIPYFEGMQSVKMPVLTTVGKNLNTGTLALGEIKDNGEINHGVSSMCYNPDYIKVMPNTEYSIKWIQEINNMRVFFYDYKGQFIGKSNSVITPNGGTFITPSNCKYIRFHIAVTYDGWQNYEVAIHKGNIIPTSYEPYKSNILTVNEPVELRGIGGVKDELDLMTGELTTRIDEIVLDGSEDEQWIRNSFSDNEVNTSINRVIFDLYIDNIGNKDTETATKNDRLPDGPASLLYSYNGSIIEGVGNPKGRIRVAILKNKLDSDSTTGFKTWLQSNPITVQYQVVAESVKTVDLSVVNQDGNDTKLSTFNDITHVTLSSEGLIPEAELKVATKNEEVLNTLSLEMDDISTIQNTLEETVNTQSENVDATMIATTEIYEELL